MAMVYSSQGVYSKSMELYEQSLAIFETAEDAGNIHSKAE
eukprot:CAMPEP_0185782618 /NCGR_PEP_ID=MMETSP1174-20130828/110216_1 /TAXON_ID=35687 /ORGANISM="Dictyocha speculum, Strain CCMP1381" /LENGTH=39 /DNA_ID= /DNA_START= /DNA_END= /DNA_ORIENTATION=